MRLTFREVVLGFRRSPLLSTLSIVTIAFSMFALGLFGLVALNVSRALRGLEEHVEVRAFLAAGTPIETITTALGDIQAFPEVQKAEYVSPEQALARARTELPEFKDVFDANVLPGSTCHDDRQKRPSSGRSGTVPIALLNSEKVGRYSRKPKQSIPRQIDPAGSLPAEAICDRCTGCVWRGCRDRGADARR